MNKLYTSFAVRTRTRKQPGAAKTVARESLSLADWRTLLESFLMRGDIERHSPATLTNHRYRVGRVAWLADKRGWASIGYTQLQQFFLYLNHAHEETTVAANGERIPCGRWDNPRETEGLKPGSVKSFHLSIRAFLNWCVAEGQLDASPLLRIASPIDRPDQVQPFTDSQVCALLLAAKRTRNPLRNEALVLLLTDCGLRVSELCALRIGDLDFMADTLLVREGKGGKSRPLSFGRNAKRAVWDYLQRERRGEDAGEPVFRSDRGADALTRRGVAMLMERLGKAARLPSTVRCSPHTARHYFAVSMLRNGANIFALKQALGHTSMAMVNRYLALSSADVAAAHRLASPIDRMKERQTKGGR